MESHEPTSASNQKRYWRNPLADSVSVLEIEMSELVASDHAKDTSIELRSLFDSEKARTSLSDIRCKNDSLDATSIVDQASRHRGLDPSE